MASSETPQTFGEQLTQLLEERGLSKRGLATKLAAASGGRVEDERRYVGRWMKSVDGPASAENRHRLAVALELDDDHPLIATRPRRVILGALAQLEARVSRLEEIAGIRDGQDDDPKRGAFDKSV